MIDCGFLWVFCDLNVEFVFLGKVLLGMGVILCGVGDFGMLLCKFWGIKEGMGGIFFGEWSCGELLFIEIVWKYFDRLIGCLYIFGFWVSFVDEVFLDFMLYEFMLFKLLFFLFFKLIEFFLFFEVEFGLVRERLLSMFVNWGFEFVVMFLYLFWFGLGILLMYLSDKDSVFLVLGFYFDFICLLMLCFKGEVGIEFIFWFCGIFRDMLFLEFFLKWFFDNLWLREDVISVLMDLFCREGFGLFVVGNVWDFFGIFGFGIGFEFFFCNCKNLEFILIIVFIVLWLFLDILLLVLFVVFWGFLWIVFVFLEVFLLMVDIICCEIFFGIDVFWF